MSFIVTGGAGFIGSCIVRALNDRGIEDIIIVDNINKSEKWLNLRNKKFIKYYHKNEFFGILPQLKNVTHIIHMGACSSTVEQDFDYLYHNNVEYSAALWNYAAERQISFIYASSAATYGTGELGFNDNKSIQDLKPLNRYGYSKHLFDLWCEKQINHPLQYVGLKYFNIYGPNEYAKGNMASMVFHGYNQILKTGKIQLFKSYNKDYPDGGQLRDFVYIKDICSIISYLIDHLEISGLFNVGTGEARSFADLAKAVFIALNRKTVIEYIEMPEELREKYQYYTKADMKKLRSVGYDTPFFTLEQGINDYVNEFLQLKYAIM